MSDYRTRAVAEIEINGNAGQQLTQLKQRADDFRDAIARAYKEGNDKLAKKLTKELKSTEKEIRNIQSQTANVEQTLRRLDKATPKELRQTLKALEKDLQKIERGSAAWNTQTQKIRQVKAELEKVNSELKVSEGRWAKFNRIINDWQTTIMGAAAAFTGLVMAGKAAVQVYADIDAEMASVRKFTGMTADEVERLNQEFKKIDTRTSREDLNKLAQEAGRLGMQSQEDVLGFVKAANQINVALDDLGEGATLTLSKLTDIFGDKERLGVEQSLLSVGSVINELSQNCTASAPYLAQFAQRMAGVGAQAKMTIPQIMGLAAVLDSQGQAVEMSATAVSKLVMDMFKQQDKIIKATGINAEKFKETLNRSTNEGLLMLIERLHELGNIDVLAPVFKDMGENGARAAQVMAALAGNINMVRQQQEVAAQAFDEATSVTKEYEVQNNTVQAQLDKARKGFTEMAAALGEKLMPVMRYFISSTSAMMRGMSIGVDFIIKYKGALITLAASWAAYTVAVNASNIALRVHYTWLVLAEKAQAIAKVAVLACSVAYNRLTGNITRADAAQKMLNTTMKMNPWGLAAAAIAAVVVGLVAFAKRTREATKAQKEMAELDQELAKIRQNHMEKLDAQKGKIERLVAVAKDETVSIENRKKAIDILNATIPNYCASLDAETGKYQENKRALDEYLQSLEKKIRLEANREEYERLIREDEKLRREIWEAENHERESFYGKTGGSRQQREALAHAYGYSTNAQGELTVLPGVAYDKKQKRKFIKQRIDKLMEYSKEEDLVIVDEAEGGGGGATIPKATPTSGGGSSHTSAVDKFKAEKEWREREDALNRIAYATGQKNYEEYTNRMLEIEELFYQKQLQHADLTENERLSIQAQLAELLRKEMESANKQEVEDEDKAYAERKAIVQQYYLDGLIDLQAYNGKMEQLELEHLKKVRDIYKEQAPTDEKAAKSLPAAEAAYNARLIADQKKRQQDYEEQTRKHQEKLDETWEEYFKGDEQKKQEHFAKTKALIDEAFKREIEKEGYTAEEKLQINRAYAEAVKKLQREIFGDKGNESQSLEQRLKGIIKSPFKGMLDDDDLDNLDKALDHVFASVSSMYDSLNKMWEMEEQLKMAQLEKRYDAEISMAEGNAYRIKEIEKKKAREQAVLKANAQKRQFAQQVLSAIAQTATAAINAYSSAAAIPIVGHVLAPIAAAMATAAGMMQVAVIKQQQSLSAAQGYAKGGFTPDGPADKAVGIVHAGEWVASQKLVNNPATRPAIDALEFAQRNNRFGSLRAEDVSRSVTAPAVIAGAAADGSMERAIVAMAAVIGGYNATMERLGQRLDEPFVTVNTVSGDRGIKQAQDEYQRLQNNSLPKSKRK
jgi:TP901 family phage tail tape measure protein